MSTPSTLKTGAMVLLALAAVFQPVAQAADQKDAGNPSAAAKQIRVKVSLHVTAAYQHTGPRPQGLTHHLVKRSIDNRYTTEYVVAAETTLTGLQKTNPLDPASQKEMDDYHARVKAQADRVYHSADNLRGKGSNAPAGLREAANPMAMMNPETMQKIMACGQDQACKQRIAMEMMAQQQAQLSGPGAKVMADMQAISDLCAGKGNKLGSKAHEACMNDEGEKRSTVKRSVTDKEPEIPELPDRYFLYRNGVNGCQFKAHAKVDESGVFHVIDVGGSGEVGATVKGEGHFDPKEFMPCSNQRAAFDTKSHLFWGGGLFAVNVEATAQRTGAGVLLGGGQIDPEVQQWVASALQGVPASGTKTQKIGYQTATLTWSFVRE